MARKPRMLVAGGGHADIPLILAAKKLGYYVITTGNRPGDLGHACADEYRLADYSLPDVMLGLARRLGVSAVCSCCNDFSALSAAYVAEAMGLPGHDKLEVVRTIHHKDLFREFSLSHGMPTPRGFGAKDLAGGMAAVRALPLPVIVKPIDLTGGKGVSKVETLHEAGSAVEKAFAASRAKRIVVEEFVSGSRHGLSLFLVDGRVVFAFADNEHYYLNPYLVAAASTPSIAPREAVDTLCAAAERYASLLGLVSGIFHMQFILREGRPLITEICRRAPGDLYIRLVEHATGVDYPSWIVKASAGLDCRGLSPVEPRGCYLRHCVMADKTGVLRALAFDPAIEANIVDKLIWGRPGDIVSDVLTHKFGIVFLRFDSRDELRNRAEAMHELIKPVIE